MISIGSILKARQLLKCRCYYGEPGNDVLIEAGDGKCYITARGETDEVFMDRVQRSVACGENLFLTECQPFHCDSDCLY